MVGEGKTRRNSYVKKYDSDLRLDWQEKAECLGQAPDFDYDQTLPTKSQAKKPRKPPSSVEGAQRTCWTECTVREACLEFALRVEIPRGRAGVYGGLTPNERDALYDQQMGQMA